MEMPKGTSSGRLLGFRESVHEFAQSGGDEAAEYSDQSAGDYAGDRAESANDDALDTRIQSGKISSEFRASAGEGLIPQQLVSCGEKDSVENTDGQQGQKRCRHPQQHHHDDPDDRRNPHEQSIDQSAFIGESHIVKDHTRYGE